MYSKHNWELYEESANRFPIATYNVDALPTEYFGSISVWCIYTKQHYWTVTTEQLSYTALYYSTFLIVGNTFKWID